MHKSNIVNSWWTSSNLKDGNGVNIIDFSFDKIIFARKEIMEQYYLQLYNEYLAEAIACGSYSEPNTEEEMKIINNTKPYLNSKYKHLVKSIECDYHL